MNDLSPRPAGHPRDTAASRTVPRPDEAGLALVAVIVALCILLTLATLTAMTLLSHTPYNDAYKSALENERPLAVLIGAPWCPHCHTLQAEVEAQLAEEGTAQRISFAYVDLDRQPMLARRLMSGDTIPQLILYQKADAGWQRRSLTGSQSAATVRKFIGQSLAE